MAFTINDVRNLVVTIAGDQVSGNPILPEQFNLLARQANLKHFKRKVGLPEEYQPGMPIPRQAYEITTKISMDLSPFKVHMGKTGELPLYVDADGYAITPTDMYYPGSMIYNYIVDGTTRTRKIDIVSDEEWVDRFGDALTQPTNRNPISNFQAGYIRFAPIKNKFVEFVYLRYPVDPVYGYTTSNGYLEYNSSTSTQFEWDDVNIIDIIVIMLFDLGIKIGRQDVLAYADKVKQEGV